MIFLSQDWQLLGHKSSDISRNTGLPLRLGESLNASIAQVTGIPENVLRNFQNGTSLSVDERLAWMNNRKNTKEEDMSYCLIGILDAPIMANYGEGGDKARKRLLAEVWRDDTYLEKLPIAQGAAFDDRENELVSECLPNSRAARTRHQRLGKFQGGPVHLLARWHGWHRKINNLQDYCSEVQRPVSSCSKLLFQEGRS